jgi:aryl-alcohol dehydrogenase-like predicted oxidoreductase
VTSYRRLGQSGLTVSALGIGCNTFGERAGADEVSAVVDAALDEGVTLFDTADVYGRGESEELLGAALRGRREQVVVATKFGMDMGGANGPDWGARGSRRYIRTAVEASLRRLQTDWLDLYQMHEPDPHTPLDETVAALQELVTEGKVRYLGTSNFAAWQVVDADWVARTGTGAPMVTAQNPYSLYDRSADADLVPACEHLGVSLLPYYPLASGLLTGKYRRDEPPPAGSRLALPRMEKRYADADFDKLEALAAYADARGLTMLDVAIGGLAAQPVIGSVIAGARSADQVRANAAAARWEPTVADLQELDALTSLRTDA